MKKSMMTFNLRLIEDSFEAVAKQGEVFVDTFYETLFTLYPQVRPLFTGDILSQRQKLLLSLTTIVEALDNPDVLVPYLEQLGEMHQQRHVSVAHYAAFRKALLQTLAQSLGPQWNADLARAWAEAFDVVTEMMLKNYD